MKKGFCLICLFILLCTPIIVKADGYVKSQTPMEDGQTNTPDENNPVEQRDGLLEDGNERIQQYRSSIERQEVKSGNEKKGSSLPLILTILTMSLAGGGYYYYQKRKA